MLVLGKIFLKNKPVALFVVAGAIVASGLLGLDARGVKLLGAKCRKGCQTSAFQRFTGPMRTSCCRWRSRAFC